jgi:hypothetical protein
VSGIAVSGGTNVSGAPTSIPPSSVRTHDPLVVSHVPLAQSAVLAQVVLHVVAFAHLSEPGHSVTTPVMQVLSVPLQLPRETR